MSSRRADTRWALWQRNVIPDSNNPDRTYLSRLRVIETPWGGLFVHAIRLPDNVRHLHDHPWPFFSVVLTGGYTETFAADLDAAVGYAAGDRRRTRQRRWKPGSVHRIRSGEFHAITELHAATAWTVLIVGPRRRRWGFATADGFVDDEAYVPAREREVR